MKDFMFLFRFNGTFDETRLSPEELQKATEKWGRWMGQLMKEGRMTPGQRLITTGKVVKGKKKQVQDGPFAEGKEVVASFCTVKAESVDDAVAMAKDCPIFEYDGSVEVREIMVYPGSRS